MTRSIVNYPLIVIESGLPAVLNRKPSILENCGTCAFEVLTYTYKDKKSIK